MHISYFLWGWKKKTRAELCNKIFHLKLNLKNADLITWFCTFLHLVSTKRLASTSNLFIKSSTEILTDWNISKWQHCLQHKAAHERIHSKTKGTSKHLFLVLQLVTNRGLISSIWKDQMVSGASSGPSWCFNIPFGPSKYLIESFIIPLKDCHAVIG